MKTKIHLLLNYIQIMYSRNLHYLCDKLKSEQLANERPTEMNEVSTKCVKAGYLPESVA